MIDVFTSFLSANPAIIAYLGPIIVGLFISIMYLIGKFYSHASSITLDKKQTIIQGFHESFNALITPIIITYFLWQLIPTGTPFNIIAILIHYLLFFPLEGALMWTTIRHGKSPNWNNHSFTSYFKPYFQSEKNFIRSLGFESADHLPTIIFSTINLTLLAISVKGFLRGDNFSVAFLLISAYIFYGQTVVILSLDSYSRVSPTFVRLVKDKTERIDGILISESEQRTNVLEITNNPKELVDLPNINEGQKKKLSKNKDLYKFFYDLRKLRELNRDFVQKLNLKTEKQYRSINEEETNEVYMINAIKSEKIGIKLLEKIHKGIILFWNYCKECYNIIKKEVRKKKKQIKEKKTQ